MGRNRWGIACGLAAATLAMSPAAQAAVPHVVQPGETLWSISAANNFTTRTVAAFNGLAENANVVAGSTIQIPTVDDGAAALASAGITPGSPQSGSASAPATGAVAHVVQPGETLWSIAAANNFTTRTVAVYNGLGEDAHVVAGSTIEIPTEAEGAAALAATGAAAEPAAASGAAGAPYGLAPAAAESWSAMRAESQASFGIDLYPSEGPLSAYRTYEQQAQLYELFLAGEGAPANPPGTSAHELGLAVDLATPEMRSVIDQIGPTYGWYAPHDNEWWHVEYWG